MGTQDSVGDDVKKWYAIKKKTHRRWWAFRIAVSDLGSLKEGYEFRGPFGSLATTLFAVNQDDGG